MLFSVTSPAAVYYYCFPPPLKKILSFSSAPGRCVVHQTRTRHMPQLRVNKSRKRENPVAKYRTTTFIIGSWSPFETGVVANVPGEGGEKKEDEGSVLCRRTAVGLNENLWGAHNGISLGPRGPEGCSGFAGPCRRRHRRRMFPLMSGHARCTLEGMGWRRRWIARTVLPTLPSNITGTPRCWYLGSLPRYHTTYNHHALLPSSKTSHSPVRRPLPLRFSRAFVFN